MKQILIVTTLIIISFGLGLTVYYFSLTPFGSLSPQEMHQRVITERNIAIEKSIEMGVYNCCVEPACTMCYMEGNIWNNNKAGTCNCADFIREGKDPCPQCKSALMQELN